MLDPRIVLILVLASAGYFAGEKVVEGVKKVDHAVVHVVKQIGHGLTHIVHR